jgi:hypothetical protein
MTCIFNSIGKISVTETSFVGWAAFFCPPLLPANRGETIKLLAYGYMAWSFSHATLVGRISYSVMRRIIKGQHSAQYGYAY